MKFISMKHVPLGKLFN